MISSGPQLCPALFNCSAEDGDTTPIGHCLKEKMRLLMEVIQDRAKKIHRKFNCICSQ